MAPDRNTSAGSSQNPDASRVQPPRPPNSWILYRSFQFDVLRQQDGRLTQSQVSKMVSAMWKAETQEVKAHFERMADEMKANHQRLYPDYRFAPQKKKDKIRPKEDRKQTRPAKKSKARVATCSNTDTDATTDVTAPMQAPPPMPFISQYYPVPGYFPGVIVPNGYMVPMIPEVYRGPTHPSPPISAAPSPPPGEGSDSSESQHSAGDVASSTSRSSTGPSSASESQPSPSSTQVPTLPLYVPLPPGSQAAPFNLNATPPTSLMSASSQYGAIIPYMQPPSQDTLNPMVNDWNNIHAQMPTPYSAEDLVRLNIPIYHSQSLGDLPRDGSGDPSVDYFHGQAPRPDLYTACNNLLAPPNGQVDISSGEQAPEVDYAGQPFVDYPLLDFQLQMQMAGFTDCTEGPSDHAPAPYRLSRDDIKAIVRAPPRTLEQVSVDAQPSAFGEDMMNFFNFDAAEGCLDDTSPAVSQQALLQNEDEFSAAPIFAAVTNTTTSISPVPYIPPAGAIYSSTRRVAATWKPPFPTPLVLGDDGQPLTAD